MTTNVITVKQVFDVITGFLLMFHTIGSEREGEKERAFVYRRTIGSLEYRYPDVNDDTIAQMVDAVYAETNIQHTVVWTSSISMDYVLYTEERS